MHHKRASDVLLIGCFSAFQGVLDTGKKLSDDNTIGKEEIQQRLAQFVDHWKELKQLAAARCVRCFCNTQLKTVTWACLDQILLNFSCLDMGH